MRFRILLLLLVMASFSPVVSAEQFGNVVYTTPEGWSRVQQADSQLLIPGDLPAGFVFTLAIGKGDALKDRTLRQFLDDTLQQQLTTGARVVSSAPVQESKTLAGAPMFSTTRVMSTREGRHYLSLYFVLQAGTRGETVIVIANSEQIVQKYSEVVGKFIASLTFAKLE